MARQLGHRTIIVVPLLRQGVPLGAISLRRHEVKPFSDKQIEWVTTFADQAVIAIENTRLFEAEQASKRQLAESLEEQTATSEVLQVISSSAGELLPVFAAILKNAVQICGAEYGQMFLFEEGSFRAVATHDLPRAWADLLARSPPIPADPKLPLGRLAATKRVVEVADLRTEQGYIDRYPTLVGLVEVGGARTLLIVPMLKENALVGAIGIHRQEVRPFTNRQIELVKSFANQAVIARLHPRLGCGRDRRHRGARKAPGACRPAGLPGKASSRWLWASETRHKCGPQRDAPGRSVIRPLTVEVVA